MEPTRTLGGEGELVAVELEEVVCGGDQSPFRPGGRSASSREPVEPAIELHLREHRLDHRLAFSVEQQIVLAAEITVDSPDFGHLGPMIEAAERQLERVGIEERLEVILADAGYWHQDQMDEIVSRG